MAATTAAAQPPRALLRLLGFACLVSGKDPPCPEDATVMSCSDWCRTVYPGSRATMSGSSCARLSAQDIKKGMGPACICYDSGYEKELKSCRSKCPVEEDPAEALGTDDAEGGTCFGSTGRDTCRADQLTDESERYLLYDVKPGEGFNLQREVFPRVGWIVAQLNAQRCSGDRCPRWTLVLPPWCRLAHWRRASEEHVPWEHFFDAKALRSTNITVLEFYEFVAKAGRPPSLDEFFQERLLHSAPGSALQSKMFDSQVDEEPEFLPSKQLPQTTPVVPQAWPRTMSGEGLEDFFAAVVVAGVTNISTGQSPSAKEMPPPPPAQDAPQFVAAELPPLPAGGYASDLPVPVKLAQVLKEPEVGTPEVPTMGSRNHRLGNCRPCAFFHTKGCSSGVDCEFCHLCDAGEKKRRAKQRAVLRKGLELQDAPQPLAVGLVTATAPLPGMPSYAPMLPGMWPPPL